MNGRKHILSETLPWLALLAAGAAMLGTGIGHESLGFDESYTLAAVSWPPDMMMDMISRDSHPPLYFLGLKAFTTLFGLGPVQARAFSALGSLALASLGLWKIRPRFGQATGLLYSLLCFLTPMTLIMGQEARMYTWAAFLVTWGFLEALDLACPPQAVPGKRPGWAPWLRLSLVSLAGALTHHYALMALVLVWAWLGIVRLLLPPTNSRKALLPWLVWGGGTASGYLPWLGHSLNQAGRVSRHYWILSTDGQDFMDALCMPWNFKYGMAFPSFLIMPLAWTLILSLGGPWIRRLGEFIAEKAGMPGGPGAPKTEVASPGTFAGLSAGFLYLGLLGVAVVLSLAFRPLLVQRYMVCGLGLVLVGLSMGLRSWMVRPERKRLAWILLGILALDGIAVSCTVVNDRFNGGMTEATAWLRKEIRPGDILLHASEHTLGTFSWYFPEYRHYLYLEDIRDTYSNYQVFERNSQWGTDPGKFLETTGQSGRIWLCFVDFQHWFHALQVLADDQDLTWVSTLHTFQAGQSWYAPSILGFRHLAPGETKPLPGDFSRISGEPQPETLPAP